MQEIFSVLILISNSDNNRFGGGKTETEKGRGKERRIRRNSDEIRITENFSPVFRQILSFTKSQIILGNLELAVAKLLFQFISNKKFESLMCVAGLN